MTHMKTDMKEKLLKEIDDFVHLCYMAFKISVGDWAKENFPQVIENLWVDDRSDAENVKEIKEMFETNRVLNENIGNPAAAQVIKAFQDGWLNKF